MRTPRTANSFVMTRKGLRDHLLRKKMSYDEYAIFNYLLLISDPGFGMVYSNATMLSSELSCARRKVQHSLSKLRQGRYIHYEDARGIKGPHDIFINKYPVLLEWGANSVWFSNIWSSDGSFIGKDFFLAQIKVRNLPSYLHISKTICDGLLIRGFELSADIVLNFTAEFAEYQKDIDLLRLSGSFCRWLVNFDMAFQMNFAGTFEGHAYKIYILRKKDLNTIKQDGAHAYLKKQQNFEIPFKEKIGNIPSVEQKIKLSELCLEVKELNHGFNPYPFIGKAIKAEIPPEIIIKVFEKILKHKDVIVNVWGYALKVLKEEYREFNYARELERHYALKNEQVDLKSIFDNLKVCENTEGVTQYGFRNKN